MDKVQAQLWYQLADYYDRTGDEAEAQKAYAIALQYDASLPPLRSARSRQRLRKMGRAGAVVTLICLALLIFYLLLTDPFAGFGFPWKEAFVLQSKSPTNELLVQKVAGVPDPLKPGLSQYRPSYAETRAIPSFTQLRHALYLFAVDRGYFPTQLDELVHARYLRDIPLEPQSKSRVVTDRFSGNGGWVYRKPAFLNPRAVEDQVEDAIFPNIDPYPDHWFAPLTVHIDKAKSTLTLFAGDVPLKTWPVAIGSAETPTPEGVFRIIEKSMLDNGALNPYGSHWMRLGEQFPVIDEGQPPSEDRLAPRGIGIHGTNNPFSIGQNVTNGCIRMFNEDIGELYDLIPNGTEVRIIFSTTAD